MAESKHTSGPWNIGAPYGVDKTEVLSPNEGRVVCTVWTKRREADRENGRMVYVTSDEGEANARLIAAAPDLYRELCTSRCPRPCNHRPDDFEVGACLDAGECGCSADAAIAKAEGRSQ